MRGVLVIGATGQLGLAAIRKLIARSARIRALVRTPEAAERFERLGVEAVSGDLTDRDSLARACAGIGVVLATANVAVPTRRTDTFEAVERDGYRNLIEAAAGAGIDRFVYTSAPASKNERLSPLLRYKRQTERLLDRSGLDHVVFRADVFMDTAFTMMGSTIPVRGSEGATALRPFRFANRHLSRIKNDIEQKHVAHVPGDGTARHGFIASEDVAEFLASAACCGRSGIYHAAGPQSLTFLDVVHIYERILGISLRIGKTPARVFRIMATVLRPFSPAGANLMALNYLSATEDSDADSGAAAEFGVRLTTAETFLRKKCTMAESS